MVLLLSLAPSAGPGAEERLYRRIEVHSVSENPHYMRGTCDIHIRFLDDILEPCETYIKFLQQSLFPQKPGVLPSRIYLGRERYATVSRLLSSEYLAKGSRGIVKEGLLGSKRLVVKTRPFYGPNSHLAKIRMEKIKHELNARIITLSNLRHPNILQYVGYFLDDNDCSPPCIGLIQDYCDSNLSALLAQHHGHDPDVDLDNREIAQLFKELDSNGDGKVIKTFLF